jgi:type I restriction enzyme S subunit
VEVKPGYKQTEVGVIPADWDLDHIEDVALITTGSKNTQDRIEDGLYPFFVRSQTIERINSYSFDGEAVLTAGDGVGTGKVFHYVNGRFDVHQRVYRISNFSERIDGYFFYLYFSTHFYNRIMQMTAKSSVDSVRRDMIARMLVPIPPTEAEQRAIASALSDVDALLVGLDRLIAKKRDLKQATMQQLLTGQTRLPGFHGEWEVKTLGDLGSTFGGLTGKTKADFGDGAAQYITFMNIMTNVVIDCGIFERVRVSPTESQNRVMKGDLLFNGSSETPEEVAMCAVLKSDVPGLFLNSFCFGFRFRDAAEADGLFLAYYLRNREGRELMKSLAQGSTRYNLSKVALLKAPLRLPSLPEQTAIAAVLSDMDAELSALEARRDKTRDLKQAMMQELLTGKTRLVPAGGAHA